MLRTQVQTLDQLLGTGGFEKNIMHYPEDTSKHLSASLEKKNAFLEGNT